MDTIQVRLYVGPALQHRPERYREQDRIPVLVTMFSTLDEWEEQKVMITVMTYPHPSRGNREVVCTAGINEHGEWIRLYPIDYRHRPPNQQFKKYQWINVSLKSRAASEDKRKESREPNLKTISNLGDPLSTKNNWEERRRIIDHLPHFTLNQLKSLYEDDKTSLGIVRPTKVLRVQVEPSEGEWKPQWRQLYSQMDLFGREMLPLRKIPFKFSYIFECEDSESPHAAMIEDWELGVLWLKLHNDLKDDAAVAEKIRQKYFAEMCSPQKDTRFFMGTVYPFNSWVVLGVFWPPRQRQFSLF